VYSEFSQTDQNLRYKKKNFEAYLLVCYTVVNDCLNVKWLFSWFIVHTLLQTFYTFPSKNRSGIPVEFQRNSRSSLDSGRSPPEFRVTETRNSGFQWILGSGSWSLADSGIRVLESGGIPGLEFCHLMAFQSRVWSPVEFRVWSSGVRLKMWRPAEFQTLVLLHLSAVITDA